MEAIAGARSLQRLKQVLKVVDQELALAPVQSPGTGVAKSCGVGCDVDAVVVLEALAVARSVILTDDRRDIERC
jgi:hypothetical protein